MDTTGEESANGQSSSALLASALHKSRKSHVQRPGKHTSVSLAIGHIHINFRGLVVIFWKNVEMHTAVCWRVKSGLLHGIALGGPQPRPGGSNVTPLLHAHLLNVDSMSFQVGHIQSRFHLAHPYLLLHFAVRRVYNEKIVLALEQLPESQWPDLHGQLGTSLKKERKLWQKYFEMSSSVRCNMHLFNKRFLERVYSASLCHASRKGHFDMVKSLLESSASPNAVDWKNGMSPMLLAMKFKSKHCQKELARYGAKPLNSVYTQTQ